MKRDSFIFYKSFYDSIKELDLLDQAQIYNAIFQYQFEGEKIELIGICKSIFTLIIPQLEANNKRYKNGLKGGAPKNNQNAKKKQPKNNLETTKKQPNENENENVNVNDNDIKEKNKKERYGSFNNVKLTKEEYQKLKDKFYDYEEKIENLSNYLAMKGDKYKNHYAVILNWSRKDDKEQHVPEWYGKEIKERERTDEEQRQLEELIRGY